MDCGDARVRERERAEIVRSAAEAHAFVFRGIDPAQVRRYLDPPANTPHALEYAYYLLGDVRAKTVVDLGCGNGENLVPLAERGAIVSGIDISPDLIRLAQERIKVAGVEAVGRVGSAYETGFDTESVDVIFCIALIHHLEIPRVRDEMWRILKKSGFVVLSEPVRLSRSYHRLRKLLPAAQGVSEFEHPLTEAELGLMGAGFTAEGRRYFRLPFVPVVERFLPQSADRLSHKASAAMLRLFPPLEHFATKLVVRLRKQA
jgi:2-polyprenyl-3-methyl-5-hydroxy-6-metoxy-1,4-benzoquinol methylase